MSFHSTSQASSCQVSSNSRNYFNLISDGVNNIANIIQYLGCGKLNMKKCLMYGNCQIGMIYKIFLNTFLMYEYNFTYINCYDDVKNNIESIDISDFDLIITQPIYQQIESKQTLGVLKKKKKDCVVIIIHSLNFRFYFLNEINIKKQNDQLHLPIDYHDKNLFDFYLRYDKDERSIINNYKEIIFSSNFYTEDIYLTTYKNSIDELKRRFLKHSDLYKDFFPIYCLPITDFIEKKYRDNLLWHSNIHPKYNPILKFICTETLSIIDKDVDLPDDFYDGNYENQLPLYQSISPLVNFDTKQYVIAKVNKQLLNIEDFVDTYLKVYNDKKNARYIDHYIRSIAINDKR